MSGKGINGTDWGMKCHSGGMNGIALESGGAVLREK